MYKSTQYKHSLLIATNYWLIIHIHILDASYKDANESEDEKRMT